MSSSARRGALALITLLVLAACTGAPGYTSRPPDGNDHGNWQPPPRPLPQPTGAPGNIFEDPGVNRPVDPRFDNQSTFAMDVDTASYDVARRFIADGQLPPYESVRLEEYVNSFDYGYRPPTDSAFAIHVDGGPTPFTSSRTLMLRIGIAGRVIPDADRAPASLTFVVDTSGSMDLGNRIALVRDALTILVGELGPQDTVAIVAFGDSARVVLNPTSAAEPQAIIDAINTLQPGGSTNAQAGLELGYDVANLSRRPGAIERVILASDGVANVGLTDADSLLQRVGREVAAGIDLVTVGVGLGNFNDALLEQLADRGNGFYAYLNDSADAQELFGERLTGTLQLIARDAKVQVEFRPETVASYRLLGYENRAIDDDDFRDPRVDAGEVGSGHQVTALYEIEIAPGARDGFLGTVRLRWTEPDGGPEQTLVQDVDLTHTASEWSRADPGFQLAATVAAFAEILRLSPAARSYDLDDVAHEAEALARWADGGEQVREFADLARRAAGLEGWW